MNLSLLEVVTQIVHSQPDKIDVAGKSDSSSILTAINFGMSSIGISVTEFLSLCSSSEAEIRDFQRKIQLNADSVTYIHIHYCLYIL